MTLPPGAFQYPNPGTNSETYFGVHPVDFTLEVVIKAGMEWFLTTPEAPDLVFGHLKSTWLNSRYGQAKIDDIGDFIKKYDIPIVQHWSLIAEKSPCISIQLLDANEEEARAALNDHSDMLDVLDMENNVIGRTQIGYSPIVDQMHIGIHSNQTPDLTKYLYYLIIYLLNGFKSQLQEKGMMLTTFRATDISRLNEYLPENIYSRFINFTSFTIAPYKKDALPIIEEILGVHVPDDRSGDTEATDSATSDGMRFVDLT